MAIIVRIPTPLRNLANGQSEIHLEAKTVRQLIEKLEASFPGFKARLCHEDGQLRRFINVYVNDEDIRFLNHLDTPLHSGDHVSIIPAIAGGSYV